MIIALYFFEFAPTSLLIMSLLDLDQHILTQIVAELGGLDFAYPLRETCRTLRECIAAPSKFNLHHRLIRATYAECPYLCTRAFIAGARGVNRMLRTSARIGNVAMCATAIECGAEDFGGMLKYALLGGHHEICDLAIARGAKMVAHMMYYAARSDDAEMWQYAQPLCSGVARDFDEYLMRGAQRGGNTKLFDILREKIGHLHVSFVESSRKNMLILSKCLKTIGISGITELEQIGYNMGCIWNYKLCETFKNKCISEGYPDSIRFLLYGAASAGCVLHCKRVRGWMPKFDTTIASDMMSDAARKGKRATFRLARKWYGDSPHPPTIVSIIVSAVRGEHIVIIRELLDWFARDISGMTDFTQALSVAVERDNYFIAEVILEWHRKHGSHTSIDWDRMSKLRGSREMHRMIAHYRAKYSM